MVRAVMPTLSLAERDRRWARARALMADHDVEALVVAGLRGRESYETYLSGESIQGIVVMGREADPIYLTWSPFRILGRDDRDAVGDFWIADIRAGLLAPSTIGALREIGCEAGRVGVVGLRSKSPMELEGFIPYGIWQPVTEALPAVEFVELSEAFALMMMEKGDEELALLRYCAEVGERACQAMLEVVSAGVDEAEIYATVMAEIYRHGATTNAPHLIVRSGSDTLGWGPPEWANLRAVPPRAVQPGDLVYAELMTNCGGLESQQQMCVSVGEPSPQRRRLGELARAAYDAGLKALRPGARFAEVCDAMAEPVLEEGSWFLSPHIHSLSPASMLGPLYVGADPGEFPFLRPTKPTINAEITAGMTFSFEPNACARRERVNIGGTVVAGPNGGEELNSLPCRLLVVE